MVLKPLQFVARGANGLLQPALKCRGREYLRIIYGPEYDLSSRWSGCEAVGFSGNGAWLFGSFFLESKR